MNNSAPGLAFSAPLPVAQRAAVGGPCWQGRTPCCTAADAPRNWSRRPPPPPTHSPSRRNASGARPSAAPGPVQRSGPRPLPWRSAPRPARPMRSVTPTSPAKGARVASRDESGSVRVNKVLAFRYSRREADDLVAAGRVSVNNVPARNGGRVYPGDVVTLDGVPFVPWQADAGPKATVSAVRDDNNNLPDHEPRKGLQQPLAHAYIKLHKPLHVACVADPTEELGVVSELNRGGYSGGPRVFPVGHLDAGSSGIVLVTSDGSLVQASLKRKGGAAVSDCFVRTATRLTDAHVRALRISGFFDEVNRAEPNADDDAICDGTSQPLSMLDNDSPLARTLRVCISGGRVKDIRKFLLKVSDAFAVESVHRISYLGIDMSGIEKPGTWALLSSPEMDAVRECLERHRPKSKSGRGNDYSH